MKAYDVVVIGAGPGGYIAAIRAAELKMKTAIIEKDHLGGVCLNVGCVPSKSLLKNAEMARFLRKDTKTFGVTIDNLTLDYAAAVERSRKVSKRLNMGVASLMKQHGVDVYMGTASFSKEGTIVTTLSDGGEERLTAKDVIIATGSHPIDLSGMEADGERILNYRHAILQTRLPKDIVIIGGGAIGVEFATVWNAYGTKVSIVEMQQHLLPNEDAEAGLELERSFKKQGIKLYTNHALSGIEKTETGVSVTIKSTEKELVIPAEQVLIAIGFRPNSEIGGLQEIGVERNPRGWITTNDFFQTNIPHIYAIGDVTGKVLLAHAASAMGRFAAETIALHQPPMPRMDLIPHATYSFPQVASVGLTEESAQAKGIPYVTGKAGFIANGKALGLGENEGWIKLICHAETGKLIGAVLIGPEVSELLPELSLAIAHEMTALDIAMNIHAHPTLSEGIMEAAQSILK